MAALVMAGSFAAGRSGRLHHKTDSARLAGDHPRAVPDRPKRTAMDKVVASPELAVADIPTGATVAIAGFGVAHRFATSLILALRDKGTKDLTLVCNSLGDPGATRGQILAENRQGKKLIAAFSVRPGTPTASEEQIAAGTMEVELVPQGILVERCRAGGAGIPAFYSPTSVGTDLAKGKETREFDGKRYILEH